MATFRITAAIYETGWATERALAAKQTELADAGAPDARVMLERDDDGARVAIDFSLDAADEGDAEKRAHAILGKVAHAYSWGVSRVLPYGPGTLPDATS